MLQRRHSPISSSTFLDSCSPSLLRSPLMDVALSSHQRFFMFSWRSFASFDGNHLLWCGRCACSFIHLRLLSCMCEFLSFSFALTPSTTKKKWVKQAIEFPRRWREAEPEPVRGPQWWPLSHTDAECSLNPFLCRSPFTHANPLRSGPGINYFISFRSGAFYSSARCA